MLIQLVHRDQSRCSDSLEDLTDDLTFSLGTFDGTYMEFCCTRKLIQLTDCFVDALLI